MKLNSLFSRTGRLPIDYPPSHALNIYIKRMSILLFTVLVNYILYFTYLSYNQIKNHLWMSGNTRLMNWNLFATFLALIIIALLLKDQFNINSTISIKSLSSTYFAIAFIGITLATGIIVMIILNSLTYYTWTKPVLLRISADISGDVTLLPVSNDVVELTTLLLSDADADLFKIGETYPEKRILIVRVDEKATIYELTEGKQFEIEYESEKSPYQKMRLVYQDNGNITVDLTSSINTPEPDLH